MEYSIPIPFSLDCLRVLWWMILGLILIGYSIAQGYDLGVCISLPFTKKEIQKRVIINTVGPFWEGNQVWLILIGGAAFAAWPYLYAVTFSGLYLAIFIILFSVILRPVGFKFRSKINHSLWRRVWDISLFLGGLIPAFSLGLLIGNFLCSGFAFEFDENLVISCKGDMTDLFSIESISWGFLFIFLMLRHGCLYLLLKTNQETFQHIQKIAGYAVWTGLFVMLVCIILVFNKGFLFDASVPLDHPMPSNPLFKEGLNLIRWCSWIKNFLQPAGLGQHSFLYLVPFLLILSSFGTLAYKSKPAFAFIASCIQFMSLFSSIGIMTFPFILPSSINFDHSLTIFDASSSQLTLFIMFLAVIIFLPLILLYTGWVYKILWGRVEEEFIHQNSKDLY